MLLFEEIDHCPPVVFVRLIEYPRHPPYLDSEETLRHFAL